MMRSPQQIDCARRRLYRKTGVIAALVESSHAGLVFASVGCLARLEFAPLLVVPQIDEPAGRAK